MLFFKQSLNFKIILPLRFFSKKKFIFVTDWIRVLNNKVFQARCKEDFVSHPFVLVLLCIECYPLFLSELFIYYII